tara:strand:- start:14 stop:529 length:516 start_codon:yes stop_codon:yes gene_type:complete
MIERDPKSPVEPVGFRAKNTGFYEKPRSFNRAIEEYRFFLERLSLRSLPTINKHVSPAASFRDPFFYDGDLDQRTELLRVLCNSATALKFRVEEVLLSKEEHKVYFKWSLRLEKDMAPLEGMSEITFDHSMMVFSQRDYWDSASTVWAANPIMRRLFNFGKKRLFGPLYNR